VKEDRRSIRTLDLVRVLLRAFVIQASWSFDRMQTLGFAYAMLPALRRLYPEGDELTSRINLHLEYFNTQPYLASFILGAAVRLEEERASGRNRDADVRGMKTALMAALGALGDSFFWGALKPFAAAVAVAVFLAGLWWAPLVFLVIYNIWHVGLRVWLLFLGYESGGDAVSLVAEFNFTKLARNLKTLSLSLFGGILGMLPLWRTELRLPVHAAVPLAIAMAGLAVTLGMVVLLRAGGTPAKLMLGLAAACVVLASLGVV
jgi:PTS system mannose-specific IID component